MLPDSAMFTKIVYFPSKKKVKHFYHKVVNCTRRAFSDADASTYLLLLVMVKIIDDVEQRSQNH